jgi:hypothetical protein
MISLPMYQCAVVDLYRYRRMVPARVHWRAAVSAPNFAVMPAKPGGACGGGALWILLAGIARLSGSTS